MTESHLETFVPDTELIMAFQPICKVDKFGKSKIDRTICLTTHHILIVYEGVLDLELKSKLEVKCLNFIIKSASSKPFELMLFFNNKQRSVMHV